MKKAIQIAYNEFFSDKCQYASESGFRYIAVNYTQINGKTEREWNEITEDIEKTLDKNGLKCIQSHPHYYHPFLSSENIDDELEFSMRQAIISSAKLGAEYCVFHPRTATSSAYRLSKSLEDNRKWFSSLLECALKHGTGIAAENLPIFPSTDQILPLFSSNCEHLSELVDYFNDDRMGVCWDFGHANLVAGDQAVSIRFLGSRIKCTHVHNNYGHSDDHAPPIYGNIEWRRIMPALADTGYKGPLTLETHCDYINSDLLRSFAKHNYDSLVYLEALMSGIKE